MTFDGSSNCWRPSEPIVSKKTARIRTAKFGDGYEQRILDGINAYDVVWTVIFENKKQDILQAIDEYLQDQKGTAFPFYHPGDATTYSVFCDEWQIEWRARMWRSTSPTYYGTLSADFRRANGVGVL